MRRAVSRAAFSVQVFGYYLVGLGLVLLVAPNVLLAPFAIPRTDEIWIRVLGVVVVNMGVYYTIAARAGLRAYFVASLFARAFVFLTFAAFALLDRTLQGLVLFGIADLVGAAWTAYELRREDASA